ncbi:hypothetical protein MTO96_029551 [Rhipicephalus appendiculatus]
MLGKEAPSCDADTDPPARIVEDLTLNQLNDEDRQRARNAKRKLAPLDRGCPREVHDFLWKMGWKVLPTRQRLNRLGIVPNARCPNCRNIESQNDALLECPAAKPVWRIVARCFGIRPPPAHKRNRGAFARLVTTSTLFVIWQRRSLAEVRSTPRVYAVKVLGVYFFCEGVAAATWKKSVERATEAVERAQQLDLTLRKKALAAKSADPPARIVEEVTHNQLTEEEKQKIDDLGLRRLSRKRLRPREADDFEWKQTAVFRPVAVSHLGPRHADVDSRVTNSSPPSPSVPPPSRAWHRGPPSLGPPGPTSHLQPGGGVMILGAAGSPGGRGRYPCCYHRPCGSCLG